MATSSSRSATIAELRRMFSNLDSTVIESVLTANNGQVDVTIDHLLTMAIDTENQNNIQQALPTIPLRQLPVVPNIYDDDPPPYPGHETTANNHTTIMSSLPQRSSSSTGNNNNQSTNAHMSENAYSQQDLQIRQWLNTDGQYRMCYIGDLTDDFLRLKFLSKSELKKTISGEKNTTSQYLEDERLAILFQDEEFLNELRHNKDFITTLHSDQPIQSSTNQSRRTTNLLSTKPLPLPTPPTIETSKTPKVRARMLQNVLTQIEQGQTMRTSMVPQESITQNEGYSYGKDDKERIPLPHAPFVPDSESLKSESNEEFIARLRHMGKNSMEKFNQLARKFSTRKDTTSNIGKYSKQSIILLFPSLSSRHRLLVHRLRDQNYSDLFSFSVGEEKNTRRTIICFKSQLMDETTILSPSTDISTSFKTISLETTASSNDASLAKRRPDQALYKPPRRSKNPEVSSPVSAPSPTPVEDTQQNNDTTKSVKSKVARPSVEPYVPPSRRSQLVNKESLPCTTSTNEKNNDDNDDGQEEEEEEDWEKLLDASDNSLTNHLLEEIQTKFKESVQIKKTTNDYSQWTIDDIQIKEGDLAHVIEVSNFPSTFRTEDLSNAFKTLTRNSFDIKWVDDTHALVIFPDANTALDALQMEYPMFKICSMSQASSASKKKAKSSIEFLQPYKARPQTSSLAANRRICAALGLKNPMSSDKTKTERQKLETAKQQKKRDKEEQKAVWDGAVLPTTSTI
ncbi:unnamed protein product [Adineta steineri]|uniref:R3H domain-containing protein n=1 Tax=Adineta steineri TaxID=433720 RepID=A0A819FCM6_9BILA|nr:unnamed protein product [Adineta steineri]CAF3864620.1 unnamed protein product [Adineta steineri]